jgi:hypothetical protein
MADMGDCSRIGHTALSWSKPSLAKQTRRRIEASHPSAWIGCDTLGPAKDLPS